MKMFKKLMAVVLTGALAVSMLTGCAVTDKVVETSVKKALETATSAKGVDTTFTSVDGSSNTGKPFKEASTAVVTELKKAIANNKKNKDYKAPDEIMLTTAVTAAGTEKTNGYTFVIAKYSTNKDTVQKSLVNKNGLTGAIKPGDKANFYVSSAFDAPEKDSKDKTVQWVLIVVKAK